jgi:hypothetical protein
MAKITFPTRKTIECPLLIDKQHLESLDELIDRHVSQMRELNEERMSETVADRVREYIGKGIIKEDGRAVYEEKFRKEIFENYGFREARSVSLYLTRGREIQAKLFSEAISQPLDENDFAIGFSVIVRVGEIRALVKAGEPSGMSVDVEPNENEVAQALFGALSNWASDVEVPKWQQKWLKYKFIAGMFLVMWLLIGLLFIPLVNWGDAGKSTTKEEARKLLAAGGINPTNERRALELLLAIESDYDPAQDHAPPLGFKYWAYTLLGAVILIAVMIYPNICIGLWKGKRRLHAWRLWMRTLTVGIPMLVVTSLLIPWVLYWMKLTPPAGP